MNEAAVAELQSDSKALKNNIRDLVYKFREKYGNVAVSGNIGAVETVFGNGEKFHRVEVEIRITID